MCLLILLLSLALERYFAASLALPRIDMIPLYVQKLMPALKDKGATASAALILLPALLGFALVYFVFENLFHGFFAWILALVTLLYGYKSLYFMQASTASEKSLETLFADAHRNAFSIIFWFAVLGPMGAFAYRLVEEFSERSARDISELLYCATTFQRLRSIFEWLPARATVLAFALTGDFVETFREWRRSLADGASKAEDLVVAAGKTALGQNVGQPNEERVLASVSLINRTLVLYLVAIGIVTISKFLH